MRIDLKAGDGQSIFTPAGVAHGFQTLEDQWPDAQTRVISERDRAFPDFSP